MAERTCFSQARPPRADQADGALRGPGPPGSNHRTITRRHTPGPSLYPKNANVAAMLVSDASRARQAASLYPKNANVAAMLGIATAGASTLQGWPRSRANLRPQIGIHSQNLGPTCSSRANPVASALGLDETTVRLVADPAAGANQGETDRGFRGLT